MVAIRIDYEAANWKETALRCLEAGAVLVGVPEPRLFELHAAAEDSGLVLRAEQTSDGCRVLPANPDGSFPELGELGGEGS